MKARMLLNGEVIERIILDASPEEHLLLYKLLNLADTVKFNEEFGISEENAKAIKDLIADMSEIEEVFLEQEEV